MTMDANRLGSSMNSAIDLVLADIATNPAGTPMTDAQRQAFAQAYAGAIISEIVNNATITTPSGPGSIT